jgi:hypothetical protein
VSCWIDLGKHSRRSRSSSGGRWWSCTRTARRNLLDAIGAAVESVGLPIVGRSYADLTLTFESKGISAKSWSGDTTTVVVTPSEAGSRASFMSKGKPSGLLRVQSKVRASKWVERLIPGFGQLWRDSTRWDNPPLNPPWYREN